MGALDAVAVARLLAALEAKRWTALQNDWGGETSIKTVAIRVGGAGVNVRADEDCVLRPELADAGSGALCQARSVVQLLEETVRPVVRPGPALPETELVVPADVPVPNDASLPAADCWKRPVPGVSCDFADGGRAECYPTKRYGVLYCLGQPWADAGTLVRAAGHQWIPVRYTDPWGAEVDGGVRCASWDGGTALACADGAELAWPVAGATRWFAHRVVVTGEGRLASQPVQLERVIPRSARARLGAELVAPSGGPFELTLRGGNANSSWQFEVHIQGDDRGARATSLDVKTHRSLARPNDGGHSGIFSGPEFEALRRLSKPDTDTYRAGRLARPAVLALWKRLDELGWSTLKSTGIPGHDLGHWQLAVRRGELERVARMSGGCGCTRLRPTEPPNGCTCAIEDAIDFLTGVAKQLPEVKWKTRVKKGPGPANDNYRNRTWGIELLGGVRCRVRPSAELQGKPLSEHNQAFRCTDGGWVTAVHEAGEAWFADLQRPDGEPTMEPVVEAWSAGEFPAGRK